MAVNNYSIQWPSTYSDTGTIDTTGTNIATFPINWVKRDSKPEPNTKPGVPVMIPNRWYRWRRWALPKVLIKAVRTAKRYLPCRHETAFAPEIAYEYRRVAIGQTKVHWRLYYGMPCFKCGRHIYRPDTSSAYINGCTLPISREVDSLEYDPNIEIFAAHMGFDTREDTKGF